MITSMLTHSDLRYRRLFEAARDGILIIDPETRLIVDVNPFLKNFLGYTHGEFVGKELFEIGLLADAAASQAAFRELQETGYIRYEDLPLKTKDGRRVDVEFVSNLYREGERQIIQCNIRDISARKRTDSALRESEERFQLVALSQRTPPITDEKQPHPSSRRASAQRRRDSRLRLSPLPTEQLRARA